MKIAIVHDYLNQYGGAERVVEVLHDIFPKAPVYTTIYLPENLPDSFRKMDIRTSFMQRLPFLDKHFKKYLLLYPKAVESFDLSDYDVVLSSSSAFAKGIKTISNTLHICYCYTPMRFAWDYERYVEKENFGKIISKTLPFFIDRLRKWDLEKNIRVDYFIAISKNVQKKIDRYYRLGSEVIYPPVNTTKFSISCKKGDYYLVVSRLNAYKGIDLVIEAFNQLGFPLKIIGDGPHRKNLEKLVKSNTEFLGKLDDDDLIKHYRHCKALIFPGDEDFGIVPVETQACGIPVIAHAMGGALETVIDGVTGILYKEMTQESLTEAITRFEKIKNNFDSKIIRENALKFDRAIFTEKIKAFIGEKTASPKACSRVFSVNN